MLQRWLAGVRVLDLSQYIPGPLATLLLADFGADVLKVEPPRGDEMRNLGPRGPRGEAVFYEALNAGKRVRRVDLKQAAGRDVFLAWARKADVLVEAFRPGVMARLGLDYDSLAAINPGLVYCSMSGYGVGGELEQAAGHDANYLALAGVLHRNGTPDPMYFDPPIADTVASLFAVIAIQGALRERERGGRGCHIDLALADVAGPLQLMQVAGYGALGYSPGPRDTYLNGGVARYQIYRTRDGRHIALGAMEDKFWRCFCDTAGHPEWLSRRDEPVPQKALIADLGAYFGGLTLEECLRCFAAPDCCVTPVLSLAEALESRYVQQRGLIRRGDDGSLQTLFPVRLNGEPPSGRAAVREDDGGDW